MEVFLYLSVLNLAPNILTVVLSTRNIEKISLGNKTEEQETLINERLNLNMLGHENCQAHLKV